MRLKWLQDVILKNEGKMMIKIGADKVTFNAGTDGKMEVLNSFECTLQTNPEVKFTFENINAISLNLDTNRLMFVVGSKVTSFDSWSSYSSEYFLVQ